ncbi:hypothetical protein T440DRAFT_400750 [Plenodomus tracheiphilus IPT5]|uniref:Uncharacterized protein n=1 Tax=Plenodomus tracheiphilus IPT5 TaxID=1408161 RepID=A0A6A7B2Z9_9PLEO|nr:hypothetical protein T440DRAFT_400750 [Plenodomus tracheiphilus IPT5]
MKIFHSIVLATTLATGVMSAAFRPRIEQRATGSSLKFANKIANSAALSAFHGTNVVYPVNHLSTRQTEPDPNRNETIPELIFVLQCTDGGFRGDCLVFGASPGDCVSYFNFQAANSTEISDRFNDKVSSLSTNTGGNCQFYKYQGCDNKGDDRGLTADYVYNLGIPLPEDPRIVEYENVITSWRC